MAGLNRARGIDHVVLCVRDLEAGRALYERLGFTLTPHARHPFGTGNSLVQMRGGFLELLAVTAPADIVPHTPNRFSLSAYAQDYLAGGEGLSALAFDTEDARLDARGFAQRGLQTYPPVDFQRPAKQPEGHSVTLGFSITFVTDPRMPRAVFFTCQHHTSELFWRADYQRHVNGAQEIGEVIMVAEAPKTLLGLFAGIQGPDAVRADGAVLSVAGPRGAVTVSTPGALGERFPGLVLAGDGAAPHFVGYRVTVENLDRTAAILRDRDVTFQGGPDRIWVEPAQAFGCVIEFSGG